MLKIPIPLVSDEQHEFILEAGMTTFVLGPNGSGKSSLLHHLAIHAPNPDHVKWIRAHRRTWIKSNVLSLTTTQLVERQMRYTTAMGWDNARYTVFDDEFDTGSLIAYLIQRKNADARNVQSLLAAGQTSDATSLAKSDVLSTLNSVLRKSNIPIAVSIGERDDVLATKHDFTYGINEMSDGERSILLLATSILTADTGPLFLLDEPERHLHRAIISPLLSTLFASRSDCSFVVSTHETALPTDNSTAEVMLVRECRFENGKPTSWDLDLIGTDHTIPEAIRSSILGARRRIVFVEGDQSSLDRSLYVRVFPNATVVPVGSCITVINTVKSIRSSSSFHRILAFGLVDRDYLDGRSVEKLEQEGIFVVDGYAVESIYYDSDIQRMVVEHNANSEYGRERLQKARERALSSFGDVVVQMCQSRAVSRRREKALIELDDLDITEGALQLGGAVMFEEEKDRFEAMVKAGNLDRLIMEYPIKKSRVPGEISKALGFLNRQAYEKVVVHLLGQSDEALAHVSKRFSKLLDAMKASENDERRRAVLR